MVDQRTKCLSVIASCYGLDIDLSKMTQLFSQVAGTTGLESILMTSNMLGIDCYIMETTIDIFENTVKAPLLIELEKDYYIVILPGKPIKGCLSVFDPMIGDIQVSINNLRRRFAALSGSFNMIAYDVTKSNFTLSGKRNVDSLPPIQLVLSVFLAVFAVVVNLLIPYLLSLVIDGSVYSGLVNTEYSTIAEIVSFVLLGVLASYAIVYMFAKSKIGYTSLSNKGLGLLLSLPPFIHNKLVQSIEHTLEIVNEYNVIRVRKLFQLLVTSLNVLLLPIFLFIYCRVCFLIILVSTVLQIILQLRYLSTNVIGYEDILFKEEKKDISKWAHYNSDSDLYRYFKDRNIDPFKNSNYLAFNKYDNIFLSTKHYLQVLTQLAVVFFLSLEMMHGLTPGKLLACVYVIMRLTLSMEDVLSVLKDRTNYLNITKHLTQILQQVKRLYPDSNVKKVLPNDKSLHMLGLTSTRNPVLGMPAINNVNLSIEQGSFVLITGHAGSGKSTLLQLILKRIEPANGDIIIGDISNTDIPDNSLVYKYYKRAAEEHLKDNPDCTFLKNIDIDTWYKVVGNVGADSVVLNDTIAANIAIHEIDPDFKRIKSLCDITGFTKFIDTLATGIQTIVGDGGLQLSDGHRMLLLLTRALYKNPSYLIFDDSFGSIDEVVEMKIWQNVRLFFKDTTIIVASGRSILGAFADKIILLDSGYVVEHGTYDELIRAKGTYYEFYKHRI